MAQRETHDTSVNARGEHDTPTCGSLLLSVSKTKQDARVSLCFTDDKLKLMTAVTEQSLNHRSVSCLNMTSSK